MTKAQTARFLDVMRKWKEDEWSDEDALDALDDLYMDLTQPAFSATRKVSGSQP